MSNDNKETKETEEIKDPQKSSTRFSKRTKILLTLFVFFMVVYTVTYILFPNSTDTNNETDNSSPVTEVTDETEVLEPTLQREAYIRPDYEALDFYTALQSLGYELNFLYEDLTDYYSKGEALGKTLQDLKDDRNFILTTLESTIQKDVNSTNSALSGESVELMYTFDEAVHYLDQIITLLEKDKDQLTTYQYSQAKERISSFEQAVSYIIYLQEESVRDKELEEQDSKEEQVKQEGVTDITE